MENKTATQRFGIGEWYGSLYTALTQEDRRKLARSQTDKQKKYYPCPFRSTKQKLPCTKIGGVCSLRLYEKSGDGVSGLPVAGKRGRLRTTCPYRFDEGDMIYRWIGEMMVEDANPAILNEIGFLEKLPEHLEEISATGRTDDVGRIDNVLVSNESEDHLVWCALEKQAVYFQGDGMGSEWKAIAEYKGDGIPFPVGLRRPDYRSSGPKRLMPQLQTKIPNLRRWGKKMAVVVDEDFFSALGKMREMNHLSNCDIAWFVVGFDEAGEKATLVRRQVWMTTLEHAVEGLTAGQPVSLETFEKRIRQKLKRSS